MPMLLLFVATLCNFAGTVQATVPSSIPATYGLSPDNAQSLLIHTIKSAKKELIINIYEFKHPKIRDAVISQIQAGVTVRILIEGEPVGGLAKDARDLIVKLTAAMHASRNSNHAAYLMRKNAKGKRRYAFDHAKYIVIDSQTVYLASENFAEGAHPTSGMQGNRGWHIVLKDLDTVNQLKATFTEDTKPDFGDIVDLLANPIPAAAAGPDSTAEQPRSIPAIATMDGTLESVKLISSPNSLPGLVDLINSAKRKLSVEAI